MPRPDTYDGTPGFCEHCWTVSDILKHWEEWETLGCVCQCHTPPEKPQTTKKGKRK